MWLIWKGIEKGKGIKKGKALLHPFSGETVQSENCVRDRFLLEVKMQAY